MPPIDTISNVIVLFIFLLFWLITFVIFYHFSRFGIGTLPKKLAALFIIGCIAIFTWSVISYQAIIFPLL